MTHFLVLEKNRTARTVQRESELSVADADSSQQFVYMLLPHGSAFRIMRARLDHVLKVAEPVREVAADSIEAREAVEADRLIAEVRGESSVRLASAGGAGSPRRLSPIRALREQFGAIEIDSAARVVTKDGGAIRLAPLEFDLLLSLYRRAGAAASRAELMEEVWCGKAGVTHRTVDTHIFNLRKKLEADPACPRHILTVSKVGYRLKL